jgi:pyruvate dehydrogenase E1 component alpha subunit
MTETQSTQEITFSKETYFEWYESMLLMRRFEEKAGQLYGNKIRGFLHLYIGQEACVAGAVSALTKDDKWISAYRSHAHALGLGSDPNKLMAELFGKATGCTKGKGGSMHFFDVEKGFFGGHGIVGGQVPLGAGMAFAEKYKGTSNLCICYMGDGAVRQGAFHEALNMSMTWKLPVIYVIENNGYAMGTSVERTSSEADLSKLALPYDMPSETVEAMDVRNVHESISRAAQRARNGEGPTLLDFKTYRYKGHSMSDAAKYRTRDEVSEFKDKDSIKQVRSIILENAWATEEELKAIDTKIKGRVADTVKFAEESPYLELDEIYTDVYEDKNYPFTTD